MRRGLPARVAWRWRHDRVAMGRRVQLHVDPLPLGQLDGLTVLDGQLDGLLLR
jgi:hypothetical protein